MAMVRTFAEIFILEPVQVDAEDFDWEEVVEFRGVCWIKPDAFFALTDSLFGEGEWFVSDTPHNNKHGARHKQYFHQNSPEIDQNSLPRKIVVRVLEFSGKLPGEKKWKPVLHTETIDCYCDEPGCEAGLTVDTVDGNMITVGNMGHIQTISLPPNYRLCKEVE